MSIVPFMFMVGPKDLCMCGLFWVYVVSWGRRGYAMVRIFSSQVMTVWCEKLQAVLIIGAGLYSWGQLYIRTWLLDVFRPMRETMVNCPVLWT